MQEMLQTIAATMGATQAALKWQLAHIDLAAQAAIHFA